MDTARRTPRTLAIVGAVITLAAGLTGCTNAVSMSAAPSANAAACAAVQVRLPATVDSKFDLRNTNAQATAAWGDPEVAIYHCGVAVPTVSDLPCFSQGGVDWIRDDRGDQVVYTTFGRSPAVQVVVDSTKTTSSVVQELSDAVSSLPKDGHECLDPDDVQG
ncbi:DUF3515 family protein [Curtobacterium flaccumfaciens]|jgi:hypothetical protein|uniref:DUF3515 family protein n=1 Tax=Curtobacterium flaccumfaciens TaxID=2035 RepID=UPI000FFE6A1E|nr:DUF3515 family protein [Curtobacterium flaccumfaciens]MCS0644797.1 DUF3515 domain-containing protein [Curtobacterium flaccumfaciens pv. flaccumfaciens]MCS6527511.1 DUF3515 domain-containing protein [Curtobacterium flaccumfaciens pv. flaccumfaciens]MCS6529529.1 DUF3515 domain-containing protein [Curtobacterium flaccumfaciens pv. flaccumfaciens]NUU10719.1 DUF3515 family protein [Curtobacterium flaccumfaciens]RXF86048.1 DUF3515 domain-containing protein [Curtobacterium flaccumfaciens pv. flacc